MAKEKTAATNMSAYFRELFSANRAWLRERSNSKVVARWLADHPGESAMPESAKGAMSNIKSLMRNNSRKRQKFAFEPTVNHAAEKAPAPPKVSKLEQLEIQIDDCFALAKIIDPEGLEHVIKLLRKARNAVVWKQGQ